MTACAIALPETIPARTVPVLDDIAGAARSRPAPVPVDIRREAARVVATTRRQWLDTAR